MKNRIKEIIVWTSVLAYILFTAGFAAKKAGEVECSTIEISLADTLNPLVSNNDILHLLENKRIEVYGKPLNQINKYQIASNIASNIPFIKRVGVYPSYDGSLNIYLVLREPLIRVINKYQRSFYIDTEGYVMPLSRNFTARVLVATGEFHESAPSGLALPLDSVYHNKSRRQPLKEVLSIVRFINEDEFLKAQIEQIHYQDGDFLLIPKVGMHYIVLGDAENIVDKFFRLKAFYYKGFNNLGWQKYKVVNLKYSNQVICVKR